MSKWGALISWIFLAACASSTPQTEAFLSRPHLHRSQRIEGVPFFQQAVGHCGPATLAMVSNWAGLKLSPDELANQVFTPGMKGSLQVDMITASRRQGLMAVPISGLDELIQEIDAGHPVIVFENLALSWLPQWHYAVVLGYDLDRETVLMHSGPEAYKTWDLRKFERSWQLADSWGLVILPAGKLSASASESTQSQAAAALEQAGRKEESLRAYSALLERWPHNLAGLLGVANSKFENKQYLQALNLLRTATSSHPTSAAAWHNRAQTEAALKDWVSARTSARQALENAPDGQKGFYQTRLQKLL